MNNGEPKKRRSATRRRIKKLPKWLDMEDICFLSGATVAELRLVADKLLDGNEHCPGIYISATNLGKFPIFSREIADKHFDLNSRGFLKKLDSCDWHEIINSICAKEYNYALASIGSVSCAHKMRNRKVMLDAQKLHIHNTASEKSLLPAEEVEKHFAIYANEVVSIFDDLITTIPVKLEGASVEEMERVLKEYGERARVRLNAVSFSGDE